VNPEVPIQPFIKELTGINNAMLQSRHQIFSVAKQIIEITDDLCSAHNADF
jgi:DNA polymerase-3 subunit epsilon